jgi:phosphoribosylcarboxyaminoimidazole (NCAIR) mutase
MARGNFKLALTTPLAMVSKNPLERVSLIYVLAIDGIQAYLAGYGAASTQSTVTGIPFVHMLRGIGIWIWLAIP